MDVHAGDAGAWLLTVLQLPHVLRMLQNFCGTHVCLASAQFFVKPAHGGHPVGWHQDGLDSVQGRFEVLSGSEGPLSLWIPLDDVDATSGGLCIIPRLHKMGKLPTAPMPADEVESGVGVGIDPSVLLAHIPSGVVQYVLRAGEAAAHHPFTPHASSRNVSDRPRRVLLLRLLPGSLAECEEYQAVHGPLVPVDDWIAGGRPARRCIELLVGGGAHCQT